MTSKDFYQQEFYKVMPSFLKKTLHLHQKCISYLLPNKHDKKSKNNKLEKQKHATKMNLGGIVLYNI